MAARIRKHHQDDVRAKIQASKIITRLQKHFDGKIALTATQIKTARILLDKSIANAPNETIHSGDPDYPITHAVKVEFVN